MVYALRLATHNPTEKANTTLPWANTVKEVNTTNTAAE